MKKRAYILLALLALLLLSGCAAQTQKREPVLALQCSHPTSLSTIRPAGDGAVGRLSKKPVIASQSADWRGNPFSKHMIFAL